MLLPPVTELIEMFNGDIHNPLKAGLCQSASSYGAYIKGAGITDRGFTLELMDREAFVAFNEAANDDRRLDESAPPLPRLSDDAAMDLLKRSLRCDSAAAFQALSPEKQEKGASIRQACHLTGASFGIVRKYARQ